MLMTADRLYTAEQVRRLDACAIGEHGLPGFTLMQRAGVAVFEAARERFTSARCWLVLCGAGNNGGDGYVVARLAREAGLKVTLCALRDPGELKGDAARAARAWCDAGGRVRQWPLRGKVQADLVIDALLGTGLDRAVEGRYRDAVARIRALGCPVVAVDIPSGIHADSGRVLGCAVRADVTVSFIGQKRGLFTGDGPDHRGELIFDELGTPAEMHEAVGPAGRRLREAIIRELLPGRALNSHKGHYGHVLVAGGDQGMSGAARLAGEAALRAGAGLVTVATHAAHAALLNLSRPELMVTTVAESGVIETLERATVLAVGPGLGTRAWGRALFDSLMQTHLPAVVDADGLNLLAEKPRQRGDWVLTPHPAEAARLAGCSVDEIQDDRVGQALRLATKFNAVVVLKGCGSVLAEPAGSYAICPLGNPGMATAGCGDVLTGVIAGLLGQRLSPWHAAQVGVAAHAAAGDRVAERQGRVGLLASDITACLPSVLNR
jgi:NAD(P)H-hydrate epimerase